jgi:hydrogenase maturation protein HypF
MPRRAIRVKGIVQGVGFRPFVYGLAVRFSLTGFVRNRVGDVFIEVEGDGASLDSFVAELAAKAPPLARIEKVVCAPVAAQGDAHFVIHASDADQPGTIFVSPDVATCDDCLREMWDPADRRHRYSFLNCTNCGPRLTIIAGAPYDRPRTTMASFDMCPTCRAEYDDSGNRRFHAQPTCCPACGPELRVVAPAGEPIAADDPLVLFAEALRGGKIGALKGLGGYHLACDARSTAAVAKLRRLKVRDEKPFALMVQDHAAAEQLCFLSAAESELLRSPRRPIVLLRKRSPSEVVDGVAPGNPCLGIMLPYTPVHHLLLRAVGDVPLVMTSGNRADEPIAFDDVDALQRLAGIADLFLTHNRPIHVRADDSVTRIVEGAEMPIRRSRGYAPAPITLPCPCLEPIVAVGGQLKGTFALGRDRHAFVSHHLGDLDHFDAYRAFVKDLTLYEELFSVKPRLLVHDLHPDYASTRYARGRSAAEGIPLLAVQHHHAHMASCMAEHGLTGAVIGVSFDGTGYGTDGAIWGGEFLVGDYEDYQRAAHFRYVGMPGGEQAIREPWRMALAHLLDAGESEDVLAARLPGRALRTVRQMLERRFNTPPTSSVGRLFDAVAALALGSDRVSYEGQAAMKLEWLAENAVDDGTYPWELEETPSGLVIDTRPLIGAVAEAVRRGQDGKSIARRFHTSMAELIVAVCVRIRDKKGVNSVALSGGVFMNALLTRETTGRLNGMGFAPYRQHQVPPNDGGLSLGQLAIAAACWRRHT